MRKKCSLLTACPLPQAGEGTYVDIYAFKGSAYATFPENGSEACNFMYAFQTGKA